MRYIYAMFLGVFILLFLAFEPSMCPITGDSKNSNMQYNDSLKNRAVYDGPSDTIPIDSFLFPGDDTHRFSTSRFVSVTGWISAVKYGGAETCNCHSKEHADQDIHIELVKDLHHTSGNQVIVCEISRFTKNDSDLSYSSIRSMVKKKVTITGYVFFDEEHKQNAINTNPEGTDLWRATCNEIHPVCKITSVN